MSTEDKQSRLTTLLAQSINAAAGSGLELEQVVACFGLTTKLLMERAADNGSVPIDPHSAFAKGLAQLADKQPAAYH